MTHVIVRGLGKILSPLPALVAWAGLAGLLYYGSRTGWTFPGVGGGGKEKAAKKAAEPERVDEEPFTPYPLDRPFDVPVVVVHNPERCPVFDTARPQAPVAGAAVTCSAAWLDFSPKCVKLKSAEVADMAGIKTAPARIERVSVSVSAHGEVQQDATATARVSPRVGGVLVALEKQLGDPVRKGELLALVDSAEVGRAKAAYLTARAVFESRERVRAAATSPPLPYRSVLDAETAAREASAHLYSARQGIGNLGLPLPSAGDEKLPDDALTRRLMYLGVPFLKRLELYARAGAGQPPTANLLPVFSPLDGVVTRRAGVVGEAVPALQPVYDVGDPARVYVYLDVRQEDVGPVKVGQEMGFKIEGGPARAAAGTVDWVSPVVDEKTRTVRVRGRVSVPSRELRGGAFGSGTVTVDPPRPALVVPADAVHWEGCTHIVFVKVPAANKGDEKGKDDDEVEFRPRRVAPFVRDGGLVEITAGLRDGEEVAVTGSHVLKNELLKSRIGAADE